jgi:FkbM family methyltransferase
MLRKVRAAWRTLRKQGVSGVFSRIGWYIHRWWLSDNWLIGKVGELRGNRVTLDGCQFNLDFPAIATAQKSTFFIGNYEVKERIAVQKIPNEGLPIIELGGGVGVVSCVTSKHFNNPTRHVVVEANPNMIPVIIAQRNLNGCNFQVIQANLAYEAAEAVFHVQARFLASSALALPDGEAVRVPSTTLQSLMEQHGFEQIVLICDIEGAEVDLFEHEADLIGARVKHLVLEFHPKLTGVEAVNRIKGQLEDLGFRLIYQGKDNYLYRNEMCAS